MGENENREKIVRTISKIVVGFITIIGILFVVNIAKNITAVELNRKEETLGGIIPNEVIENVNEENKRTKTKSYIFMSDTEQTKTPIIVSKDALLLDADRMKDIMWQSSDKVTYPDGVEEDKETIIFMKLDDEEKYILLIPRYSDSFGEMTTSGLIKMSYYRTLKNKNLLSSLIYTDSNVKEREIFNTPILSYQEGRIMYDIYAYTNIENFRTQIKYNPMYELVVKRETILPNGDKLELGQTVPTEKLNYYREIYSDILHKPQLQSGDMYISVLPRIYLAEREGKLIFEFNETFQDGYLQKLQDGLTLGVPSEAN